MKILYLLIATLKFLAVTILILLLLVLLLIIIILAVPIKYKVYINKSEEIYINASVKWLYSMVGMDIIYNSDGDMVKKFKVFGKVLGPRKPKKAKATRAKQIKESRHKMKNTQEEAPRANKTRDKTQTHIEMTPDQPIKEKKSKKVKKNKKKNGFKETLTKVQSFLYKRELVDDTLTLIKKLVSCLWPSKVNIELEIGREDPADTGQLIAFISALYPIYYSFANIIGNYEKECFYGKLDASGSFTLGRLVYEILKYIRRTSVRQLIKFIRKDRKGKRNERKVTQ